MTARTRRGYTLMELILVLGVIALLAGILVPSLKGMYGYYKLQAAVDTVRSAWAEARARAIAESRPYRFAVVADANAFRVAPDQSDYWGGGQGPGNDPHGKGLVLEETLPRGVHFAIGEAGGSPGANRAAPGGSDDIDVAADLNRKQTGAPPAPDAYTTAAVFLPDGTARDDVKIIFQVKGARPTAIHLRAMTGFVSVKTLPH
jgi:prepilin-type N-terminal cleavage/methylation domain-containing protein